MGDRAGRHLERGGPGSPTQGDGSFSNYIPTDVLECIRPIAQRKAALINDYAIKRVHSERPALGLKAESVRDVQVIDADDEDQSVVREWLHSLPIPADETVIVSWDEDTAVTAPFAVVAEYWSDFFYGSSDDAAIVPPGVSWMLVWDHEGTFDRERSPDSR
jgi:hypothetical protein